MKRQESKHWTVSQVVFHANLITREAVEMVVERINEVHGQ